MLRIDDGKAPLELRDVLVGDVWLASGQSNMEWPISQSANPEAEIARATDPLIRHFKVPRSWAGLPQWQLAGGEWIASSPDVAGNFKPVLHQAAFDNLDGDLLGFQPGSGDLGQKPLFIARSVEV